MSEEFATKDEVHSIRTRLELIERSLRREVGPFLDVVETAAGVVAAAVGGTVGKVADVVGEVVRACKGHPEQPTFCGLDGCAFTPAPSPEP